MDREFKIEITDNEDFQHGFQWIDRETGQPYVFTGSTFKMDVKATVDAGTVDYALTTGNSRIVSSDLANGSIELVFEKGQLPVGEYVADLIRVVSGKDEKLTDFEIIVSKGVTA